MAQNTVSFVGTLATEVISSDEGDDLRVARFRLMLQSRHLDTTTGVWTTADRTFVSVVCRRRLAENVADVLHRGDPVVVTGLLRTRRREGRFPRMEIEAQAVGPDLSRISVASLVPARATG